MPCTLVLTKWKQQLLESHLVLNLRLIYSIQFDSPLLAFFYSNFPSKKQKKISSKSTTIAIFLKGIIIMTDQKSFGLLKTNFERIINQSWIPGQFPSEDRGAFFQIFWIFCLLFFCFPPSSRRHFFNQGMAHSFASWTVIYKDIAKKRNGGRTLP